MSRGDRRPTPEPRESTQPRRQNERKANRTILNRTIVLLVVCGILIFIPLVRTLYQLCITDHDYYQELATRQHTRDSTVSAMRGRIFDANGSVMAMSATVYDLILSPRDVIASVDEDDFKDEEGVLDQAAYDAEVAAVKREIVDGVCQVLPQLDRAAVEDHMSRDSYYQVLIKKLETEDSEKVREYISENKLSPGLYLSPSSKRYYPYGDLAAQVVGFVNDSGGAYGVEALYEDDLAGTIGRTVYSKVVNGREMPNGTASYVEASNGCDVTLTIDTTIQEFATQACREGIETYGVLDGAFCIVMDPNSGRILAQVSLPDYDLNEPGAIKDASLAASLDAIRNNASATEEEISEATAAARFEQWRNKTVNETYEPGSVFKSLVLSAALEEGVVKESDTFYCPGYYVVNGVRISCWKAGGHGTQTLAEAVQNSCNPAFMQIGQKLGAEKFYDYFEAYGMREATGVDLQGEEIGQSWDRDYFTSAEGYLSLATASFGQRFTVTPIRLITAVAAAVNGGKLYTPYVVDHVTDAQGNIVMQNQPTVVRQVISEQTSERVASILETVVSHGTGSNAYVAGYRVGGKTGTSEPLEEDSHAYTVSFLGFAPADDPQIVVLLALKNPEWGYGMYTKKGQYISGGQMAGPLVGKVIEQSLEYLGVEREYTEAEANGRNVSMPGVTGQPLDSAIAAVEKKGLTYRKVGSGDTVTGQIPKSGASVPGGSQVSLYLGDETPPAETQVPDVTGKSLDQARQTMARAGLFLRATGSTYYTSATLAISQSVEPGATVPTGQVIEVRFANNDILD